MAAIQRIASAVWRGELKTGSGAITATSGVLRDTPFSYATRFENARGTNPEELIAAAHAGCFTMALSAQITNAGHEPTELKTVATVSMEKQDAGWAITQIHLDTQGKVPGIDAAKFAELAETAKKGCPISRALSATPISMTAKLL
jgi:lipoyl-dependent peroxiredoxin